MLRVDLGADRIALRPARQVGEEDPGVPVAVLQTGADDFGHVGHVDRLVRHQGRRHGARPPADAPGDAAAQIPPAGGGRSRAISEGRPGPATRTSRRFLPFVSASGRLIHTRPAAR
ncbi:hypothetical protein ADK74_17375 [Streptomyces decoyicus]|nr:hypothetical protein ADK74_17375 [Streptomyces decoyicus]